MEYTEIVWLHEPINQIKTKEIVRLVKITENYKNFTFVTVFYINAFILNLNQKLG